MAILELKSVTKSFDGIKAVDNLTASFEPGKVTSLIGPNGAGKTTLFNLISGVLQSDSGEILLQGKPLNGLAAWQRAQRGIGRLWQDVRVFPKLTVLDNVLLAQKDNPGETIWKNFFSLALVRKQQKYALGQARHWLSFVRLTDYENSLAGDLSYGQQKLLSIARLLVNEARLLLLDEPTSGIHPHLIDEILLLIKEIVAEGRTVIIIEHNFAVVSRISDQVFLMTKGRIDLAGGPEEVAKAPLLKEAYLGI
jgi:ABC-type branched-subunit amino acid transport system ATPase component